MQEAISYLSQREAAEVDEILMGPLGFSVDQLMVSVAIVCFISRNSFVECQYMFRFLLGFKIGLIRHSNGLKVNLFKYFGFRSWLD